MSDGTTTVVETPKPVKAAKVKKEKVAAKSFGYKIIARVECPTCASLKSAEGKFNCSHAKRDRKELQIAMPLNQDGTINAAELKLKCPLVAAPKPAPVPKVKKEKKVAEPKVKKEKKVATPVETPAPAAVVA